MISGYHWSSQLFDLLAASSSSDVHVLLRAKSAYYLFETAFRSDLRPCQVKGYAVSKISLDSCKRSLRQFKVAFAGSNLK